MTLPELESPERDPAGTPRAARAASRGGPRVAFCIDNMEVGGTELNAVRTAPHLLEQGVDLSVLCLSTEGPLLDRYAELGIPVHFLPIGKLYGGPAWRYGRELARTIRRERIRIVHAHDFYSNIFAAPWSRLAGAAFIASRRWWEGPDRRLQRWANRCSYALANRVLANSPAVARYLIEVEHVRRSRVTVVPNFLEDDAFDPPSAAWEAQAARELGLPERRTVLGVVASLQRIKDHATLLRAVAGLVPNRPDLHVVLVGSDRGCRAELEQLASGLGLQDRVHFAGARPARPSWHYLFDISLLTSVSEGLPNSLLEAMAAGRPVVATAVGAVGDVVVDGVTGLLAPPRDPAALQEQLARLLGDPRLRARMGEAGRARVREHHSVSAALGPLLATYAALAPRRSA